MSNNLIVMKPCPFCGGIGAINEHEGKTMSGHYTAVAYCEGCDLTMPWQQYGNTKQEAWANAASDWNTRPAANVALVANAILKRDIKGDGDITERYRELAKAALDAAGVPHD
jgi:Lar family restriction alleviation protein